MTKDSQRHLWTFYILILTQTFSMIGSRISGLAIGFYVFAQTGEATPLALVGFFSLIPMILASNLSGVLADRWDRRYVMMIADAGQAVGTLLLLVSFASGEFQLWHLYLVTVLNSTFAVFQGPAFQASVTMLIPDNQRDRANAIQQLTGPMAGIIAPAIAGLVYALVGVNGAIVFDLVTFAVGVLVVFLIRIPKPTETAEGRALRGSVWREVMGGFQYLLKRRVLLFLTLLISVLNFLFSAALALQTPYILSRTGSEATLGVLLSVMNAGALIGGIVIGVWGGTRPRMNTVIPAMIVSGTGLATFGMAQTPVLLGVSLFLMMFPVPMINALFMSILQAKIAPDLQGRVFAVLGQISLLLSPLAFLGIGPLADQVFEPAVEQPGWERVAGLVGSLPGAGFGLIMLICGGIVVGVSLLLVFVPAIRNMEVTLPDYVAESAKMETPLPQVEAAAGA
jgi:MFS family permease